MISKAIDIISYWIYCIKRFIVNRKNKKDYEIYPLD